MTVNYHFITNKFNSKSAMNLAHSFSVIFICFEVGGIFLRVFNWTLVAASSHKVGRTICSGGAQDQSEFQKGKETKSPMPGEAFHRKAN